MIVAALIVPSAPLLLPGYRGLADPAEPIREQAVRALRERLAHVDRVVVVASREMGSPELASPEMASPGVASPELASPGVASPGVASREVASPGVASPELTSRERRPRHTKGSLASRVARVLLTAAGWDGTIEDVPVAFDATAAEVDAAAKATVAAAGSPLDRALLLVPADGSARRTEKAPGHFDARAGELDEILLDALRAGDAAALAALDPVLCEQVWLTGRASLQVLARAVGQGQATGEVLWSADPFGVLYVIAAWHVGAPGEFNADALHNRACHPEPSRRPRPSRRRPPGAASC